MKILTCTGSPSGQFELSPEAPCDAFELRPHPKTQEIDFQFLRQKTTKTLIFCAHVLGPEKMYQMASTALKAQIDWIDYGLIKDPPNPQKAIVSYHNFTDHQIDDQDWQILKNTQAGMKKCAILIKDAADGLHFLKQRWQELKGHKTLVFMGKNGQFQRYLYSTYGSDWMYFKDKEDELTKQLSLTQFETFHHRTPDALTRVYALIGSPIQHSLSPSLHNLFFKLRDINARYLLWPTEKAELLLSSLPDSCEGLSITTPCKQALTRFLSPALPSVNTLLRQKDQFRAFNTDSIGLEEALNQNHASWRDYKTLAILGSGAVAQGFLVWGRQHFQNILLLCRQPEKIKPLLQKEICLDLNDCPHLKKTLILQTTPLTETLPIKKNSLDPSSLVVEMNYNPPETALLRVCQQKGIPSISGLQIFLYQGLEQQKIWFGDCLKPKELEGLPWLKTGFV